MSNKYIKNNGNGNFKVTVPFEINTYNSWSVITKIVTPENFEDCTLINTTDIDGNDIKSFKLDLNSAGHLILSLSINGTSYDYNLLSSSILETNNQVYYINVSWSGTMYTVKVSTNNIDWISFIQQDISDALSANLVYVNFIPSIDSEYFKGKLDINSTQLIKKTSSDSESVTIFSGDTASQSGYLNYGATIVDNIASGFDTDKYIVCNGIELKDYVTIITKIHVNNYQYEVNHPIVTNLNRQGIFVNNGRLGLSLTTDGREIIGSYGPTSQIAWGKDYFIGYVFKLDNGVYKHSLYYLQDDGYYNNYAELPDFNATCIKPWISGGSVNSDENIFKNLLYIGSNKVNYLDGTIDLNNTIISNNVVTYSVSKPSLTSISSPNIRCYIPEVGTRVLSAPSTSIEDIELSPMVKFSINAQDIDEQYPIDLTNATITYSVTNSNYGSTYYKQTTDKTTIYVLPGSDVTYYVSNVLAYANASKTVSNVTTDTTDTIDLTCNLYYTFKINATDSQGFNMNAESTFKITYDNVTSYTDTLQVKYGRPVSYEVYSSRYNMTYNGTTGNLYNNETVNIKFDSDLYYAKISGYGLTSLNLIGKVNKIISVYGGIQEVKTCVSKYQTGVYILNGSLYYCHLDSSGNVLKDQIPIKDAPQYAMYPTDWAFIGTDCAIRNNTIYGIYLPPQYSSAYAEATTLPAYNYVDAYYRQATGHKYCTALTNNGDLYYQDNSNQYVLASNVTKMCGTSGYDTAYSFVGYYVNNTGLHCYNASRTDTLMSSNTNWTVLVPTFGICDGKLYGIYGNYLYALSNDTDWQDVGYYNTVNYSTYSESWSGFVYAIKGGNVVKVQVSGQGTNPTINVTQLTSNDIYSKLSYGYTRSESTSSTRNVYSGIFTSKKNSLNNYEPYIIRGNDLVRSFDSKYVVDFGGMSQTSYSITNSTYDIGDVAILHLGTVTKL